MPYFPKNRIQSNLFTQGAEFMLESTKEQYRGFYFKTYTGQYFTGKTPQDKPNRVLIPIDDAGSGINISDQQIKFLNKNSDSYNQTKGITGKSLDISSELPSHIVIEPAESNYQIGEFTRYFYRKRNETLFLETTKEHYTNTLKNKSKGTYTLYKPFKLSWKLTGTAEEVYNVNKNITLLTEREQNLRGLSQYLNNPLQFYRLDS